MERLTFEGNFCDIAQCRELPCPYNGACSQRKVWERLKAYEDTGLTPEEFHAYWVFLEDMIGEQKVSEALDRFRQLVKADKDGRLVVLPCKVGQRVFALLGTDKHISECEVKQIGMGNKIGFIGLELIGARGREYGISLNGFGKTVFRTREEAEKALRRAENG